LSGAFYAGLYRPNDKHRPTSKSCMKYNLYITPDLGSTQPPLQWVQGAPFPGRKSPGREADHSPPYSDEVKKTWSYTSTPSVRLHDVVFN